MGGKLRFMIYFVLSMYATWFWWIGYTKFAKVPFDDSCEDKNSYGFMFHRVKLTENWYLKTNFAFGAAGSVIFGAIFVGYIFHYYDAMIRDLREAITSQTHPVAGEAGGLLAGETGGGMGAGGGALAKEKEPIGSREPNPPWWKPFLAGSIMAVTIASVESIILWNGIKGVNSILSTGQLIPFVIGIGGLLKICFRWWQVSRAWKNVLVIVDILDGPDKGVR